MNERIANELTETVTAVAEKLRSLDEQRASHRPGPDRWTVKEMV